jgi:CRP-like cAMP-binding protein
LHIYRNPTFATFTSLSISSITRPGTIIYRAGDEGLSLFTIRTGLVKLTQYLLDGLPDETQRIVRLLGKTDVLGLECMASPSYQHSTIALQRTEACRPPVAGLKRLMHSNPQLF